MANKDIKTSLLSDPHIGDEPPISNSLKASAVDTDPQNMMEVFKKTAAKAKTIEPTILPFTVEKEQLALTIDSNLVYYDRSR